MWNSGHFFTQNDDGTSAPAWPNFSFQTVTNSGIYPGPSSYTPPTISTEWSVPAQASQSTVQSSIGIETRMQHAMNRSKSKSYRATQACDQCRYRKQRCDEGSPCSFCQEHGIPCVYRTMTSKRLDKTVDGVTESIAAHSKAISTLVKKMDDAIAALARLESATEVKVSKTQSVELLEDHRAILTSTNVAGDEHGQRLSALSSWPIVREVLSTADVAFDDERIRMIEDRHVPITRRSRRARKADIHGATPVDEASTSYTGSSPLQIFGPGTHTDDGRQMNEILSSQTASSTVALLINGFLANIGACYPFLDTITLRSMFQQCSRQQNYSTSSREQASIARVTINGEGGHLKRQRRDPKSQGSKQSPDSTSPESAIIMLCCALGEMTLNRGVKTNPLDSAKSDTDQYSGSAQPYVPGMKYFIAGTELILDFVDGHELIHAQAFLLAGMYKALCMRLNEASRWYCMAGQVLIQIIHRRHLLVVAVALKTQGAKSTVGELVQEPSEDLVLRAAWTCVQLELGLVTELRLPLSGLERLAFALKMPEANGDSTIGPYPSPPSGVLGQVERHLLPFAAQVSVRKIELEIQHELFSDHRHDRSPASIDRTLKTLASKLQQWRVQLHPFLQWEDEDRPSNDFALAWLRHRYWEVKLMLLRPFVDYTIGAPTPFDMEQVETSNLADSPTNIHHLWHTIRHKERFSGTAELHDLARLGIQAALQALRCFNNVSQSSMRSSPDPLPVAHTQFMNALFLVATYRNSELCYLVTKPELVELLGKTTTHLRGLEAMSPLAKTELDVLNQVQTAVLGGGCK